MRVVARWQTKGKDFIELHHDGRYYSYVGNCQGGTLPAPIFTDEDAMVWMERGWGSNGAGPVTVLKSDRSSLKRCTI